MDGYSRSFFIVPIIILNVLVAIAVPNIREARQRSKQQRTMATMRDVSTRIENGAKSVTARDAWGHPMEIRILPNHYSVRAAGADGKFRYEAFRMITSYADDLVFMDGGFAQMPEGI